jgi:uncharacterized protein YecT (DUF1311 family)
MYFPRGMAVICPNPLRPRASGFLNLEPKPVSGPTRPVTRAEPFRDDSLQAHPAGVLKRQVRIEEAALYAVYNARIAYLVSYPELAATLRNAQTAWLHFRDANCAYIQAVDQANAEESFQDCVLRSTVSRRLELRWSVGD